jgi:predicted nucleic acid-binding protein
MACYVDTSALVALFLNEPKSADVAHWYASCGDELVSSVWCVTEFASALGIKQRTGQITPEQANGAWLNFERLCGNDLRLIPAESALFHHAAVMTLVVESGLRAGDALHLASALAAKVTHILTLDQVFARNASRMKMASLEI